MNLWESFLIALTALRANLLRSILTTLGIVIGVASVIILVALGSGASDQVDKRIKAFGTNMLVIFPGSSHFRGRSGGAGTEIPLSDGDVAAIRKSVTDVVAISGQLNEKGPVVRGAANWSTTLSGVGADYTTVRDWPVATGQGLSPNHVRSAQRVAVIGATVAKQLFPGEDPVGARIRVKNVPFVIIGVLRPRGQSGFGRDQDDILLMPITTARNRVLGKSEVQNNQVGTIYVKFDGDSDLVTAQEELETLLRERRRTRLGAKDNFRVRNLSEFIRARTEVLSTLSWLLAGTSVISLVVGGIGIMNIMLVSVTERTREIGLRLAVGAKRQDILRQFLVEAIALCLLGGVIGAALGIGISGLIAFFAGWPVTVGPGIIALALGAAGATGIVFGFFPARRAAFLNPIDALRSE